MDSRKTESEVASGGAPGEPDPWTVSRFRAGDIEALAALFEIYGARIHGLARRMLGNPADAEDATQEIFVRAFEQAAKFEGRSRLYTWLYRLAVRHCLNKITQRSRRNGHERALTVAQHPEQATPAPPPLDRLIDEEREGLLDDLMQSLPPHYRACLLLREVEGLTYARIGELLEIPVGTVMSRLARARETLRTHLRESEEYRDPDGNCADAAVVKPTEEQARDDLC